jgi:3-hydroxyacyl-CoA dehydrogenase/3-hydroxy-2-methylbutyryl-CoA dehydrogenase
MAAGVSREIHSLSRVVALVTGAASGLGRAVAARLARQGASVVLADLPSSEGDAVARELGGATAFVPADMEPLSKDTPETRTPLSKDTPETRTPLSKDTPEMRTPL